VGQPVSDILRIFSVTNTSAGCTPSPSTPCNFQITGNFQSDIDPGNLGNVPAGTPAGRIMLEDGTFVNFFSPDELRIQVRSDAPEVPEPGTLTLLGLGLAGLGFRALRGRHADGHLTPIC
jgi:hypothetical protein